MLLKILLPLHKIGIGYLGLLCCMALLISGCSETKSANSTSADELSFYKVGHRGTRGLMPENTIPAMEKSLEVGANTIEFDVHITKDNKVIVYHDASINPAYTSLPDQQITKKNRKQYTFYKMDYKQIQLFKVGKNKTDFPDQQKLTTTIPLLSTLIDSVESYTNRHNIPSAHYLLEIKSSPSTDGDEQPLPDEYIQLLMQTLRPYLKTLGKRLIIQSFDMRPIKIIHEKYPDITLGYLVGNKKLDLQADIKALGFTPAFYNPYFKSVTPPLLDAAHTKGIKVCPWTVDKKDDIRKLKKMGVDGIITDYPNLL